MKVWKTERINERLNESMNERMNECKNEWLYEQGCRILVDGLDTGSILQDLEAAQLFTQKLTFTNQVRASYSRQPILEKLFLTIYLFNL